MGTTKQSTTAPFAQGSTTLYAQLASVLRSRIFANEWPDDRSLPTIEEMAAEYGLARATVARAFQILAKEGLLVIQRGRGTRVRNSTPNVASQVFGQAAFALNVQVPDYNVQILSIAEVGELPRKLLDAGPVFRGRYILVKKIDRNGIRPYCLSRIYLPDAIFKRFPRGSESRTKLTQLVLRNAPLKINSGSERILIAAADFEEATSLDMTMASPVARATRVLIDGNGRIAYYGETTYRGDVFAIERDLSIELG